METALDLAATQAPPRATRKSHNAEGGAHPIRAAPGRKLKMTDVEPGWFGEWDIGKGLHRGLQGGNVRARSTTNETCQPLACIRAHDQNVLVRFQRFFCGEDKSGTPDNACRRPASRAVDYHKPWRDSVAKVSDAIRDGVKRRGVG